MSDWLEAVFIHYKIDARILQRAVLFPLDQREGMAWVSVVAFTMRGCGLRAEENFPNGCAVSRRRSVF